MSFYGRYGLSPIETFTGQSLLTAISQKRLLAPSVPLSAQPNIDLLSTYYTRQAPVEPVPPPAPLTGGFDSTMCEACAPNMMPGPPTGPCCVPNPQFKPTGQTMFPGSGLIDQRYGPDGPPPLTGQSHGAATADAALPKWVVPVVGAAAGLAAIAIIWTQSTKRFGGYRRRSRR